MPLDCIFVTGSLPGRCHLDIFLQKFGALVSASLEHVGVCIRRLDHGLAGRQLPYWSGSKAGIRPAELS